MEFFLRVWDRDKEGSNRSSNFQEAARNWRMEESQRILDGILNPFGKFIATAHHREDQLETILLKVLRGTFISNIRGVRRNMAKFLFGGFLLMVSFSLSLSLFSFSLLAILDERSR